MITSDYLSTSTFRPQSSTPDPSKWAAFKTKIFNVVKKIFIFLLGSLMFATNSTLFSITGICSAIWDNQAQKIIEKIDTIWMKQNWNVMVMAAIAAYLAIQVTWAVGSIYFAMNLGKNLSQAD